MTNDLRAAKARACVVLVGTLITGFAFFGIDAKGPSPELAAIPSQSVPLERPKAQPAEWDAGRWGGWISTLSLQDGFKAKISRCVASGDCVRTESGNVERIDLSLMEKGFEPCLSADCGINIGQRGEAHVEAKLDGSLVVRWIDGDDGKPRQYRSIPVANGASVSWVDANID